MASSANGAFAKPNPSYRWARSAECMAPRARSDKEVAFFAGVSAGCCIVQARDRTAAIATEQTASTFNIRRRPALGMNHARAFH